MKTIIETLKKDVSDQNELTLRIIARIELVAIERFYNADKKTLVRQLVKLINKLPNNSNIILEKTIAKYYLALVDKKKEEAKEISNILKVTGYDKYLFNKN